MKKITEVDFRMCKYRIDTFRITVPGLDEPYTVEPLAISDMIIEKDYDVYQFPYFRVTIGVPNKVRRAMRKKHTLIKAYIRMVYARFTTQDTTGIPEKTPTESTYIADNFILYTPESSPEITTDIEETIEKETMPPGIHTDFQNLTTVEVLVYRAKDVNLVKQAPNLLPYRNMNLSDIATAYMTTVGFKKVLMSPPDNNKKIYDQFPIPALRPDEQVLRICCDYGIHKYGTLLFFDWDKTYIINKTNKCTVWVPNEYKTIYVINATATEEVASTIQGSSYEAEDHCGYCTMTDARSDAESMEREQVFGASFDIIDKKTGTVKSVKADSTTIEGGGGVSRTMVSYDGDASTAEALKKRIEEESTVMTAILEGTDLTMLAPNKEYKLSFMSTKLKRYNGTYRLTKYTCIFSVTDGLWFTPTIAATFVGKKLDS